jgi:cytochrome c oxidase assembly protein subunit 15
VPSPVPTLSIYPALAPRWRLVLGATLAATWALMVLGALTRASMAGLACPDWPLCHGHVVPPLEQAAYPRDPSYLVAKVYLEFVHRVLAGVVSIGALLVVAKVWAARARGTALALVAVLGVQVFAGAVTVRLQNEPYTVVVHLALALGFLAALLAAGRRLSGAERRATAARGARWGVVLLGLIAAQMLVGATVSSSSYGLACENFPLCAGGLLPDAWTPPAAWQMAHRGLGTLVVVVALGLAAVTWRTAASPVERALAVLLGAGVGAEVLLGALLVWLRVPPWASAAHLGLAAALFGLVAARALALRGRPSHAVASPLSGS